MKIGFFSNHFILHQEDIALSLYELTGGNYNFVACEPLPMERKDSGYIDMNSKYDFIVRPYESEEQQKKAEKIAKECDVMIIGSAPEYYVDLRRKADKNKIIIRYSERLFKRGRYRILYHKLLKKDKEWFNLSKNNMYKNDNTYLLCSSAYTSYDMSTFGFSENKCLKWGYFPKVPKNDVEELFENKKSDKIHLLWCARFLRWKHPEKAVIVAEALKKKGIDFELTMIGNGKYYERTKKLVLQKKLEDVIAFTGSIPTSEVYEYMKKSHIFLFTSNFKEGWGAVLNEAMSCGCAVVASHAIGSVPYLIEDGKNGLIYKNNSNKDLINKVIYLCEDSKLRESVGRNAYKTINGLWNPKESAKRLYEICENLYCGSKLTFFENGPCSKAKIIKNNWY